MSEITDEKVKEIAEGLISEHQAHQIVYLIGEDDKSIMTTNEQRREIAIESAKISCLHIFKFCISIKYRWFNAPPSAIPEPLTAICGHTLQALAFIL